MGYIERNYSMIKDTKGIVVYVSSLKFVKNLKRFGNISYVSRRLKYVILYVDGQTSTSVINKIGSFHFVRNVEISYKPEIKTEYENLKDKAKEYDMKSEEFM